MDEEVAGRVAMVESLVCRGGFLRAKEFDSSPHENLVHVLTD
jgi:hypothetical protein